MNRFDERKQKLINIIANSSGCITGKALSMSLHISLRTVQGDVAAINKILPLIHSTNKGYSIIRENYLMLSTKTADSFENSDHIMIKKLMFTDVPFQIDEFADSLYMSTSTLERKLKNLQPLLADYHLKMHRKKSYLQITGNELDKRKLINHLIFKEINPAFNTIHNLSNYFPDINVEKIKSITLNSICKYDYFVEDTYYNNILVSIAIALYRMRSDYYIKDKIPYKVSEDSAEYRIADEICEQYATHCCIKPSEYDISYIAMLLEGQIKPLDRKHEVSYSSDILTSRYIDELDVILKSVFDSYMMHIDYSDCLYNFALHIDGMIRRSKNTQPANNEMLDNIKNHCPFIHDISVAIAKKIAEKYDIEISDSEIGFISIHIGYLIETAAKRTETVSVLLLCDDYRKINETIKNKLQENFSEFITVHSFRFQDDALPDTNADLYITTKPIELLGKKVLMVSPFYTVADHMNVHRAVQECIREKNKAKQNKFFSSFFHESLFFRNLDFQKKEDIICFLGKKIVDFGIAGKDFIESVLERERLSSTCFLDAFAVPHAIHMNADRTMVCILTSEKGIPWDDHKIHIVLMIAVHQQDRKEFMELYDGIVRILDNPINIKQLAAAKTPSEFIHRLANMNSIH
ncbi:BglG family transcription antiterminator [Anaerostipes sp.]|uniref:BglG family transcription antiterminator n=1 Tax=Anaerostipes sp. TaxID=1872530 RepID=UPI0025B803C3|nr:PTS sugar transporter subunit IIA [Anaerostipes sp.]MBS7009449.1 PTS sugar transporter subunit IIA [Anaerostipes sp.]